MHFFQGQTADDVWLQAAAELRSGTGVYHQNSRVGGTEEILGACFEVKNPRQRWITSREPAINPAFALAEVVWIIMGRQDSAFINYWNPKLPQFAGNGKTYHGAYGYRLRHGYKINQLDRAYKALKENPDSRQVVLQIWNPMTDLPAPDGQPVALDIPCNITSFLKIRNGRLEWTQILRSNDLVLGVPHNFVQFTTLQEILAGWLNVEVGSYRHYSDCLHVYTRDLKSISEPERVEPELNNAKLRFSKEQSDRFFLDLAKRMMAMTRPSLSQQQLKNLVHKHDLPSELNDWLLILGADCSRRQGWLDLAAELGAVCSNPVLNQLWNRWLSRTRQFGGAAKATAVTSFQQWFSFKTI